jgi:polysaccharide deacetylase 2 family uncharacterized protein YibQ
MTKKSGKKKKTSKKSRTQKTQLKKSVSGLLFLIVLVVLAGLLAHQLLLRRSSIQSIEPSVKSLAGKKKVHKPPVYEIYPEKEIHYKKSITKPKPILTKKLPKVAIIIDDIGYDKKIAEKFLNLDAVLTFSLLPHSLFQDKIARKAHEKGFEIMLHLPLEPLEYPSVNPGPGTLFTSMSPDELIIQLNKNLDAEPDFIRKQIKLLIRIADKHGEAIGIAHPHIITYNILRELLPELQKKVQLVPASELVHIPS